MFTVYVLYSEKRDQDQNGIKTDQDQNVGIIHKFELIDKGRKHCFFYLSEKKSLRLFKSSIFTDKSQVKKKLTQI